MCRFFYRLDFHQGENLMTTDYGIDAVNMTSLAISSFLAVSKYGRKLYGYSL